MVDEIKATGANFNTSQISRLGAYARSINPVAEKTSEVTDRVEISALAVWLGKYSDMPEVRSDLVNRIRSEIQAGKYETPEKWNQAIENLMEDLSE